MSRYLDLLMAEVQYEHALRLDDPDVIPRERKPFQHRPRPNTALIAHACARKSEIGESNMTKPKRPKPRPRPQY